MIRLNINKKIITFLSSLFIINFYVSNLIAYSTSTNPPSVWQKSNIPVKWELNESGCTELGIDETEAACKAAFKTWQDVDCANITFEYTGRVSSTKIEMDSINRLIWQTDNWAYSSDAIGITQTWISNETIVEADIEFNEVDFEWTTNGNKAVGDTVDLQSIATHEIGHLFGLDHSTDTQAVMFPAYSGGDSLRYLGEDDINGICFLYPDQGSGCEIAEDCPYGYECVAGDCQFQGVNGDDDVCSPCIPPDTCGSALDLCILYPEGRFYCGKYCESDQDCANVPGCEDRQCKCIPLNNDSSKQCAPQNLTCNTSVTCENNDDCAPGEKCDDNHICVPDVSGNGELGDNCESRDDCKTGFCIQGKCTYQCNWIDPENSCPEGYYCATIECGLGVCLQGEKGFKDIGDECFDNTECSSLYCMSTGSPAVCSIPCSPDSFATCPQDWSCLNINDSGCGICICEISQIGEECQRNSDCFSGLCVTKSGQSRCSKYCGDNDLCPDDFDCLQAGQDVNICWPENLAIGDICNDDSQCMEGLDCIPKEGIKYCSKECIVNCDCPSHYSCDVTDDGQRFCIKKNDDSDNEDSKGCSCRFVNNTENNYSMINIIFTFLYLLIF